MNYINVFRYSIKFQLEIFYIDNSNHKFYYDLLYSTIISEKNWIDLNNIIFFRETAPLHDCQNFFLNCQQSLRHYVYILERIGSQCFDLQRL